MINTKSNIILGKTVAAKVNEIKMNTMKSQAMDAVAASQRYYTELSLYNIMNITIIIIE